ncbi:hypothetical protein [Profundibacter sp.]|uniref:hypothetical protein n=1 Tax=Profundibacter sp. TaxID=3101071 RepID=UPI003D10F817
MLGKIDNGSGDDVFCLFNGDGCYIKGFAHEYQDGAPSPEMFFRDVPVAFNQAAQEPAFSPEYVSYCFWRMNDGRGWESSIAWDEIDTDVYFLLEDLVGNPVTYLKFAADYYVVKLDSDPVASVFNQHPVTKALAIALNPEIDWLCLESGGN